MQKPSFGWQSWSPPYQTWHGLPRWDYSPFPHHFDQQTLKSSRVIKHKIIYWCSWYAHATNIDDQVIRKTVEVIRKNKLPITHLLIDDGWTTWGDWLSPDPTKFSDFKWTIRHIHKAGYKVGLWFSPFLADKTSKLYQSHPEWFIKYKKRHIQGLKTMPIWESLMPQRYLLDFSLPEVQRFTKQYLKQAVLDWGVDLLKLDFLYAPYFDPNHLTPHIPASHLNWLLAYLKNNYPSVQTIACGAPFQDSSALVDAIRVSKDTALPPYIPNFINKIVYLSRVKMLQETLKSNLPPMLNLDPDVRMFNLDSAPTSKFWDTIQTPVVGIGDDLLKLNRLNVRKAKIWLKNLSSQS